MNKQKIRKPNRLYGYNYSINGAYFITVCLSDEETILSQLTANAPVGASISHPIIQLTDTGIIVENGIKQIQEHYENVCVDNYVIMPNHIHLIIRINASGQAMPVPTISRVIQQFKGYVTKQIGNSIWQKSFYDHIIRDDEDYYLKYNYIENNPQNWIDKNTT